MISREQGADKAMNSEASDSIIYKVDVPANRLFTSGMTYDYAKS